MAGIDTLKQSTRSVASLNAGYRKELPGGFVAGVELGYGVTDGDLTLNDPINRLTIDYKNNSQFSYGVQAGYSFGTENGTLVFAYLSEAKRTSRDNPRALGRGQPKGQTGPAALWPGRRTKRGRSDLDTGHGGLITRGLRRPAHQYRSQEQI